MTTTLLQERLPGVIAYKAIMLTKSSAGTKPSWSVSNHHSMCPHNPGLSGERRVMEHSLPTKLEL
jgi:hypothetical protein